MKDNSTKLFENLQKAFLRDIAESIRTELRDLPIRTEEKRKLVWTLTFNVLSLMDGTRAQEVNGWPSSPFVQFLFGDPDSEDGAEIIGDNEETYMHEMMPGEDDPLFDPDRP